MKIETNMKIINKNGLVAVGNITVDNIITIQDVKVFDRATTEERNQGVENWSISLPRRRGKDGWNDIIYLRNPDVRAEIEEKVYGEIRESFFHDRNLEPKIDVHVVPYSKDTLAGYASVVYENAIEIKGIQIHKEEGKFRIRFPYNLNDGRFQGLIQLNTEGITNLMKKRIEETYNSVVKEREGQKSEKKKTERSR